MHSGSEPAGGLKQPFVGHEELLPSDVLALSAPSWYSDTFVLCVGGRHCVTILSRVPVLGVDRVLKILRSIWTACTRIITASGRWGSAAPSC
jgi:hypothetical protein